MAKRIRAEVRNAVHRRIRRKVRGTTERPRLAVYRSLNHIYAQVIDDEKAQTIAAASTTEKTLGAKTGGNIEAAKLVGQTIAERALAAGIERVVFDRGGYLYHGRVRALTDAARAAGLNKDEAVETEAAAAAEASAKETSPDEASPKPKRAKKEKKEPSAKEPSAKESSPTELKADDAGTKKEPAEAKGDNDSGNAAPKVKEE
jgi:large subunit ribosomal protein L18